MELPEQEAYLRNLIALAKADDVVLIEENDFLAAAARQIDAPAGVLAKLLSEPRPQRLDLKPMTRLSTRVRCVEDMIELAMVDGDVAMDEKRVLFVAAQEAGITRENVAVMIEEARHRRAASAPTE